MSREKGQIIPEKIRKNVEVWAWKYGIPTARKWATKVYPYHKFARETVRDWKARYHTFFNESRAPTEESPALFSFPQLSMPSTVSDDLTNEIKLINLRVVGCTASEKVITWVGNGVLAAKYSKKLQQNGRSNTLFIKWERKLLRSTDWLQGKDITAKREVNSALFKELVFTWKKEIAKTVFEHKIPSDLILYFDQTPLGFANPLKTTHTKRNSQNFPITNSDYKCQITATFTVDLLGKFMPITNFHQDNQLVSSKSENSFRVWYNTFT